ncbi:sulfurtransferase [Planctomonas psychrotolerans]|uniref:sulfurtransferase n=1 Tax=Planctomonas psychrotolerans TaxID=2528712 RepID=UPI00123C718A|nr:sulfurtransferase [Planctomonas psychrotolerans]
MAEELPPFVDAAWLQANRDDVVLADVRWYLDGRSGRDAYDAGHLPGAVFVDLERWLSGPGGAGTGRHPLPSPETFAAGMSALGIGESSTVVAYDDAGGVIAARLVWMLRATGHRAALLDGGVQNVDGELETVPVELPPDVFTAAPWPQSRLATLDDVADPAVIVVDARNRERFDGAAPDPVDPRSGHVPGARNVPCRENLESDGRLRSTAELTAAFAAAGVVTAADGRNVVAYCGSGVTACHNLLALEHLGLGVGRLFVGGWSQYSSLPDLPVAVSAAPSALSPTFPV